MSVGNIQIVLPFNRLQTEISKVLPKSRLLEEKHRSGSFGDTYRVLGPGTFAKRSVGIVKIPGGKVGSFLLEFAIRANNDDLHCGLDLQDTGFVPKTIAHYPLSVNVDGNEQAFFRADEGDLIPHALLREFIYGINVTDAIQCDVITVSEFDDMFLNFHTALHEKGYKNTDGQSSNFKIDLEPKKRRFILLDTRMGKANVLEEELSTKVSYVSGGLFGCYKALRGLSLEEEIPVDMKEKICALVGINLSDLSA